MNDGYIYWAGENLSDLNIKLTLQFTTFKNVRISKYSLIFLEIDFLVYPVEASGKD
jgi:hypothetical protein